MPQIRPASELKTPTKSLDIEDIFNSEVNEISIDIERASELGKNSIQYELPCAFDTDIKPETAKVILYGRLVDILEDKGYLVAFDTRGKKDILIVRWNVTESHELERYRRIVKKHKVQHRPNN